MNIIPDFDLNLAGAILGDMQRRPMYEGYAESQVLAPQEVPFIEGTHIGVREAREVPDPRIAQVAKRRAKNRRARRARKAQRAA